MRRLAILLMLVGFGCGSNSDPAISPATAQADCNSYINIACNKVVSCVPNGNANDLNDCISTVITALDCAKVIGETAERSLCESQLLKLSCTVFLSGGNVNPPASCTGVFILP